MFAFSLTLISIRQFMCKFWTFRQIPIKINIWPIRYMHIRIFKFLILFCGATAQTGAGPPSFEVFKSHTIRYTNARRCRTPLSEWSARRRHRYLHNIQKEHKRRTSVHSVGFKPTIPAIERPQNFVLDCRATEVGKFHLYSLVLIV
jgi:hypothetical protein